MKIVFYYLNTSHVKVNHELRLGDFATISNLNTSHVKVNQKARVIPYITLDYLNTSHVKVNLVISKLMHRG